MSEDGWRRLACSVVLTAIADAREGNGHSADARAWLAGDGAHRLVALLDLDPAGVDRVLAELPPAWVQLELEVAG